MTPVLAMGTRVHSCLQVLSPQSSSLSPISGAEYASGAVLTPSNQIVLPRQSSGCSSASINFSTQLKQVVGARLKKIQRTKSSSVASFSPYCADFGANGIPQSQNSFVSKVFHTQRRRVGVSCSLSNPSAPSSPSSSPPSKDSGSAHSSSLFPPSAVSLGSEATYTNGASSFVESMTTAEGSFFESVTRPEELNLTEGSELSVQIFDGLDDQNGTLLDPELQGILANIADMQRQNEMLSEQMKEFQQLLTKTTRSLNVKAQEAKIEAAKLKKLAKLHQIEEIRRGDEIRRKILESRIQEELRERTSLEDAFQRRRQDVTEDEPADLEQGTLFSFKELNSGVEEVLQENEGVASEESTEGKENAEAQETLECVISHPGALSCTKTVIKSDPSRKSAVVMMETTVSCAGDACFLTSLDEDDYVALAVQTLAETAQELKTSRFQRATDTDPVQHRKHNAISELLSTGRIVKARPMEPPSKFGHESFVVQLLNKQTGQKIDAMCKPGIEGHADGWHRAAIELVAYELNLMLGMDYVPPVAYRSGGVDVNYKHFSDGAFVYYVPNTVPLRKVPATNWGVSVALLLSDTRILDVLLNNSDRHHGHFLFGEHWADGKMRPVLIDHAAGFRKEAVVKMDHENAFQTGPVRCVSSKTYLRLRFLEKQTIESKFKGILSSEEVNKMMDRRDMILSYLDNLVSERGYHKTVIET